MYQENKWTESASDIAEQVCEYCGGELSRIMLDDESYMKCIECKRINY